MSDPIPSPSEVKSIAPPLNTTMPTVIYVLYLASLFLGITGLIGVILAYVNKGTNSELIESHYQFQIRTFWIGLLYFIIGWLLTLIVIGWLVLLFYIIWLIIRCAKGIKLLNLQQPIPEPKSWLFGNH
ncbi:MAG: glycolate oxidase FAD binding subunit [Thiomicrorhabdus sp.]|nr:MAG: glycolate oxidase FAD binding subunit [Thiomicrorhabdus sp.]